MILLSLMLGIVLWTTTLFYIFKRILIGAVAAVMWIIMGSYTYSLSTAMNDVYMLMGIFFILVGMFYSWEVWCDINVERKAEAEEARAEDLDDLQDRYEDALDSFDDKEARKLKVQIEDLKSRDGKTININSRVSQIRDIKEDRKIKKFKRTGKF